MLITAHQPPTVRPRRSSQSSRHRLKVRKHRIPPRSRSRHLPRLPHPQQPHSTLQSLQDNRTTHRIEIRFRKGNAFARPHSSHETQHRGRYRDVHVARRRWHFPRRRDGSFDGHFQSQAADCQRSRRQGQDPEGIQELPGGCAEEAGADVGERGQRIYLWDVRADEEKHKMVWMALKSKPEIAGI